MKKIFIATVLLAMQSGASQAQFVEDAYRYSGSHAGGPANDLIPRGAPRPERRRVVDPAYQYSGSHAGGPADALIPNGMPRIEPRHPVDPAYQHAGSHAGGPADELIPAAGVPGRARR